MGRVDNGVGGTLGARESWLNVSAKGRGWEGDGRERERGRRQQQSRGCVMTDVSIVVCLGIMGEGDTVVKLCARMNVCAVYRVVLIMMIKGG